MDALHEGEIEIVSPTFMNQQVLADDEVLRPSRVRPAPSPTATTVAEKIVFDKADEAESLETLREKSKKLEGEIDRIEAQKKELSDGAAKSGLQVERERLETRRDYLQKHITQREAEVEGKEA